MFNLFKTNFIGKRASVALLLIFFQVISCNVIQAQSSTVSISTTLNRHTISPYIYGVNGNVNDSAVKAIRQGGNRWTNYNWENGLSNSGSDGTKNTTDGYLLTGVPSDVASQPGCVATYFHNVARQYNQFFLTTVQAQGYVSAINGVATKAPSTFWFPVVANKKAAFSLTPDLTDGVVYIDEYINYLKSKHGPANRGGINAYSIDNEPDDWYTSHPMAQTSAPTIASLVYKTWTTSFAVKSVDSTALIFGPALAGWYGCKNFNSNDPMWDNVYSSQYHSEWFVSMYLDTMRALSQLKGKRVIDVLDIHWYPSASSGGGASIVSTGAGTEPITPGAIIARIQNPRSLWDSTYVENSSIANGTALQLINHLKSSVDKHFPGTKIGITEFKYGAENHYSGGLALADALGVFGMEDVFFASKWYATGSTVFQSYSATAYNLYTNYDGNYSSFGDVSVQSLNSSNDTLSSHASLDKQNRLHVVVINKMTTPTNTNFAFNDSYYKNAVVYGFDSTSATITKRDSIKTITGFNTCSYSLPGYSALHFIFNPVVISQISSITTGTSNNKVVTLTFTLPIKNETLSVDSFVLKNASDTLKIQSVTINNNVVTLNLVDSIKRGDTTVTLSYANKTIHDTSNFAIPGIQNSPVVNVLTGSTPVLLSATLLSDGKTVSCVFSKSLASISQSGFAIKTDTTAIVIDTISFVKNTNTINISLKERFANTYVLTGALIQSITFVDGTSIISIPTFNITNDGPNFALSVESAIIENAGFNISLDFNKSISQITNVNKIQVSVNDTLIYFSSAISGIDVLLSLKRKIEYGESVKISYIDSGYIRSNDGSYLESFSETLANNVSAASPRVTIPGRVESENMYYNIGTPASVISTPIVSNGKYLQMNTASVAGYRVYAGKDSIYSCIFNYSSGNTSIIIKIDSTEIDTVLLPQPTSSTTVFSNYGILKHLTKGNHTIEITDMAYNLNFDYIDFKYGSHLPKVVVTNNYVYSTGLGFGVSFKIL